MKIVLDTNVLVSALLSPFGKPAALLASVVTGQVTLCMDERILAEYRDVLSRPAFHFSKQAVDTLLEFFEKEGLFILPHPLSETLPDPDDAPFLEVALASQADALVTGNLKHYPEKSRHGIAVLSPNEFFSKF